MAPLPPDLGDRIRDARMALGWYQADLAREAGVHWRTIQKWESGVVPRKVNRSAGREAVRELGRILGVDLTGEVAAAERATTAPKLTDASDTQWMAEGADRLARRGQQVRQLQDQLAAAHAELDRLRRQINEAPSGVLGQAGNWAARRRETPDDE